MNFNYISLGVCSLGKGEVVSSILTGSTTRFPPLVARSSPAGDKFRQQVMTPKYAR